MGREEEEEQAGVSPWARSKMTGIEVEQLSQVCLEEMEEEGQV